ncbi:hypothetical protein AMAG_11307 [Allomyces macrogynus ATCC 38327]|uniref:Amine oxidase domain-containing protein n=1 Tax=Allomyces macrogynus (strain ATCC 38327) TaxID=578462 RepID=A0A0L0SWT9_ALLM3|nr:hypothetical protein AMAG_11307 [Allomyces macrogynus ATCC 38327]|eukprot:KNE66824.1 hypothetical protein AMAG_11307 [Allomyces macrogynus ATCC 38327]
MTRAHSSRARGVSAISTLLLLAVLLTSSATLAVVHAAPKTQTKTKVLILGAGVAGVTAARTLTANNITDYLILEAQDVIGGRLKQAPLGDVKIEMGGNWVEGVGGKVENPVWALAKQYGLKTTKTVLEDRITIMADGKLDTSDVNKEWDEKFAKAQEIIADHARRGLEDISTRTALLMAGWRLKSPLHDLYEYFEIDYEFCSDASINSGFYTADISTFEEYGEDNMFVTDQRGYKFIAEKLLEEAQAKNKVRFNQRVTDVVYDKSGVTVTTRDGSIYRADYVISTFSLGVYQENEVSFTPPLPEWKTEALFKFRMEIYQKIFLNFPRKWWSNNTFTLFASERKGYYPIWQNVMAPGYFEPASDGKRNIIMVTLTGNEATRAERLTNDQIIDEVMAVLRQMYPGQEIPRPTDIVVPRWKADPLFHGSFTNWPLGMTLESWENLVAPLNKRFFFSGEMASLTMFGYVHGALDAGQTTASQVVQCIKSKCPTFKYFPTGLKACAQRPTTLRRREQGPRGHVVMSTGQEGVEI